MEERESLEVAIAVLDAQRVLLGEDVVEASLARLRSQLATLPPAESGERAMSSRPLPSAVATTSQEVRAGRPDAPRPADDPQDDDRRVGVLGRVGPFRGCAPAVLAHVTRALVPLTLPAGSIVCRQGEVGDELYVIEAGTLAVVLEIGGRAHEVSRLGPGDVVGEMALLGSGRRSATVRAETPATLWSLSATDYRALLEQEPDLARALEGAARGRTAQNVRTELEAVQRNLAGLTRERLVLRIGRDEDNDLVFPSPLVSGHHAIIERRAEGALLRDVSGAGTYVNGARVQSAVLADGDEIQLGDERLIYDRREVARWVEPRGMRVDVTDLGKTVGGGKVLLRHISCSLLPGELVAILGGSGAGKTTLLDALSGVRPATEGTVRYNGRAYYGSMGRYRDLIGYVPQDDIIHTELPVRTILHHAARLRLAPDLPRAARHGIVDATIAALGLTPQAGLPVHRLSGGQRKRASIGVELLTSPRIFFLDEPTSGLDPATDAQLMRLLRRLADDGSTVLLTTHATRNALLCDKVIFLARGGHLAFVGAPRRALRYFGAETFEEIYERLAEEGAPEELAQRFRASADYTRMAADQPQPASGATGDDGPHQRAGLRGMGRAVARQGRQFAVLSRRNVDLYRNNPATLLPLVGPVFIVLVLLLVLFRRGIFQTGTPDPNAAVELLFFLAFSSFTYGLIFSIVSIVKEYPIFVRERMANLGVVPYVLSKLVVPVPCLVGFMALTVLVLRVFDRLPSGGLDVYSGLLTTLVLTAVAGVALGLLTSATAPAVQQATDVLPVWISPQVLFAGGLVPVASMSVVGQWVSLATVVRWSFEALGHSTRTAGVLAQASSPMGAALLAQYGDTFSRALTADWLILAAFIVVPLIVTCVVLQRRTTVW